MMDDASNLGLVRRYQGKRFPDTVVSLPVRKRRLPLSRHFWIAITLIVTAFALYELGINLLLQARNDELVATMAEACFKPASVPDVDQFAAFYFPPNTPISRGVMVP